MIITLYIVISEMKKNSCIRQKSVLTECFPHRYQIIFARLENAWEKDPLKREIFGEDPMKWLEVSNNVLLPHTLEAINGSSVRYNF